jgi:Ca2+-transporting ATPase
MRTLGFACGSFPNNKIPVKDGRLDTRNLTFQGFVAISDPVREDVPDAVQECTDAGIQVKVVTGDTTATAREIARQIGLWDEDKDKMGVNIKTGPEIAAMSDEELQECAQQVKIVARARPMDKKRLVEALQAKGEVVAVTGDGTNDAPALKTAHVGLSMGDGTAVAKEASDITIIDNSFSSIGRAVMWGRSLY